jgi:lysophospholipase L1-like esterase
MTYLALGDSYTIGEGVRESESFPWLTTELLRKEGVSIEDPEIIAVTGWTTADLMKAIAKKNLQKRYDIVSLLIGVNNQYQGRTIFEYEMEFRNLVQIAIKFASGKPNHVFILSIPDYSVTPFASHLNRQSIYGEILEFNFFNRKIAAECAVNYIEITEKSRKVTEDPALLAPDGLHYSGKEYGRWAALLASSAMQAFL